MSLDAVVRHTQDYRRFSGSMPRDGGVSESHDVIGGGAPALYLAGAVVPIANIQDERPPHSNLDQS